MERLGLRPVLMGGLVASVAVCAAVVLSGVATGVAPAVALGVAMTAVVFAIVEGRLGDRRSPATPAAADEALLPVMARELERSRRHERPLSIVRLRLVEGGPIGAAGRYLAMTIASTLRTIDEVVAEGDSIYLILSETDSASARACMRRLGDRHPGVFAEADARLAVFPDDGVTLAALTAKLDGAERVVDPDELPSLERRRRVTVDLTAIQTTIAESRSGADADADAVDA